VPSQSNFTCPQSTVPTLRPLQHYIRDTSGCNERLIVSTWHNATWHIHRHDSSSWLFTNCPTQSIVYVPLQVNRSQKCIWLNVQYKYIKSVPEIFILQNLILRTRLCGTGFITQPSWFLDFHMTESARWKWFVWAVYKFWKGISVGPALKYFTWFIGAGRYPPKKCLVSGFWTPYTPFCLTCTISSDLTCICHLHPFWASSYDYT